MTIQAHLLWLMII